MMIRTTSFGNSCLCLGRALESVTAMFFDIPFSSQRRCDRRGPLVGSILRCELRTTAPNQNEEKLFLLSVILVAWLP